MNGNLITSNLRVEDAAATCLSRHRHNSKPVVVVHKQDIFRFQICMNQVEIMQD
jgi:hypothetical protein